MIEINLLPGPKKRKGPGFTMPDLGEVLASVKDPLLLGVVGLWVVVGAFIGLVFMIESRKLDVLEPELRQAQADARQFTALIAQKRRMEELRDSLVLELDAIRAIDADRYVWAHILEEVTKALPEFTWLTSIDNIPSPPPIEGEELAAKPAVRFSVEGRTSDIQAYTRFVRQLENSPWLQAIEFGATQTVTEQERQITSFTIRGTFGAADSAFVRVQPVTETLQ